MTLLFGAIDIGASSGRVIAGLFPGGKLELVELHRFQNQPHEKNGRLIWDFDHLISEVRVGLVKLGTFAEEKGLEITSVGVDTWAVDYGLVKDGELTGQPHSYRDPLNKLGTERVAGLESFTRLYEISGIQYLPFNTVYQLSKQLVLDSDQITDASDILMIPDLIGFELTGVKRTELTNASSTGLLDAKTRTWSMELAETLGLKEVISKFAPLSAPGSTVGKLLPGLHPKLDSTELILVASHDTASAVVGIPATDGDFAFISSGTWSLLGTEISDPILTPMASQANFTNELGADNRVRFLKNLGGLWLLSESLRHFRETGQTHDLAELLEEAASYSPKELFHVEDDAFLEPGDMPSRIAKQMINAGQTPPSSPGELVAVILHSLAQSYAQNLELLTEITGKVFSRLHVIGGGSQNELLSQLTADYSGLEVVAGPMEATAIGNLLIQYRSAKDPDMGLEALRQVILDSDVHLKTYRPKEK